MRRDLEVFLVEPIQATKRTKMSEKEEFLQAMTPSIGPVSNSNIFKLQRKFDDWNPIDHASVPRKLRSAMNKRNRDSTSSPLPCAKKLHQKTYRNGVESPHIHGAKKSKWNTKQRGGSDQSPSITKDEEEVVEALYALAKMFPRDKPVESGLDRKTSDAYTYPLQETEEICMVTSEAPKDEDSMKSRYASISTQTTHVSTLEAAEETVTESPLISPTVQERSIISRNKNFDLSLDFSVAQSVSEIASLLCKSDNSDDTPWSNVANLGDSSKRFLGTGLAQTIQQKELFNEKKQHSGLWPVDSTVIEQEQQPLVKVKKEMLSSKAAAWMDSYSCVTNLNSNGNGISTEKSQIQLVIRDRRKSWKKCTAHVYISHFIQSLQNVEEKSERPVSPTQLKPNEGTNCGASQTNEAVDLRSSQNGFSSVGFTTDLNGVFSFGSPNGSFARRNPDAPRLEIVQDKGLQQQQLQACTTSGIYTSEKKSCEFLSLSAGNDDLEFTTTTTSDICIQGENRLESLGEHRVPYHPQTIHRHQLMPFSLSHAWSSSSHSNQLKAPAVHQLQLPQHSSNPICHPPHLGAAGSQLQQNHHQQQHQHHHHVYHQQQISTAQLALVSQCKSRGVPLSHFPRWQNVRPDSSTLGLCSQPTLLSSSPPEGQVTKFSPGLQQQQQLLSISMASSSSSGQGHHNYLLCGGYYDESSVFYSEHPSNLQILCNVKHL